MAQPTFIRVLSDADRVTYLRVFTVQKAGDWATADRLIKRIENPLLRGHLLFQRYMHPTAYRSSYKELAAWLARYNDHPQAARIHKLALRRKPKGAPAPRPPVSKAWRFAERERSAFEIHNPRCSDARRRAARRIETKVRSLLRRERPTQALTWITEVDIQRQLTDVEFDRLRSWIAASYFMEQVDSRALRLAADVAKANRAAVPLADWTAGLAAWRLGELRQAAQHFEALAGARHVGRWERSAAAYWAARAHLRTREPGKVIPLLRVAAETPLSFYGLMARRQLGLDASDGWPMPALKRAGFERLKRDGGVVRAVALAEIGQLQAAEQELSWAHGRLNDADDTNLLALARHLRLAHAQLKIALAGRADGLEAGLFPVPTYEPEGGYAVDRAVLFAIMRKESKFLADAQSHAGARGLMQVMPATAHYVSGDRSYLGAGRKRLFEPSHNIALAQRYAKKLFGMVEPEGNLLMTLCAYNAGPGNLRRWRGSVRYDGDPLLFIESIPISETRNYVEKVMASIWLYRASLGQPTPSLDQLVAGDWPVYVPLDGSARVAAAAPGR